MVVKRGDMFYADLSPVVGSEQGGIRPVLIIQNDLGNNDNWLTCHQNQDYQLSEPEPAKV